MSSLKRRLGITAMRGRVPEGCASNVLSGISIRSTLDIMGLLPIDYNDLKSPSCTSKATVLSLQYRACNTV